MEPKFINRSGFTIVGVKYRGKNENMEIPGLWGEFGQRYKHFRHRTEAEISYGAADNHEEGSGEFDYVAGVAVSSVKDQPSDLTIWEIPAATYAVFTTTLPAVRESFDHIYHDWLPNSDYVRQPGPEFELYDERFNPQDPKSEFDIYIPIRPKAD